jgi:hypothetical protein
MTEEIDVEQWLAIRKDVHRHKRDQSTMGWIATSRCRQHGGSRNSAAGTLRTVVHSTLDQELATTIFTSAI